MTIEEAAASIGHTVIYTSFGGRHTEEGVIASVSNSWVYVRYGTDKHPQGSGAQVLKLVED